MDRTISTTAPAAPDAVYPIVADLGTYEHWLKLVHKVEPAHADPTDIGPAWWITLRAKVGPFARSKRLRMVRTADEAPRSVRFERAELDGKQHSAWIMQAGVSPGRSADESNVEVSLDYDGQLWNVALDAVLGGAIDNAIGGLHQYVSDRS